MPWCESPGRANNNQSFKSTVYESFKIKLLAVAALLTMSLGVQPARAQFFKKLVKAAGQVLDAASSESDSSKSSSKSSKSSKGSKSGGVSSLVNVTMVEAARYGNSVRVGFVVDNPTADKLKVVINGAGLVSGGSEYELSAAQWGSWGLMYSSMTYGSEYVPDKAKIKGYLFFKDVPSEVTTIDRLKLYASYGKSSDGGYSFDDPFDEATKTIPGMAIEPYRACTPEGSYSTFPEFTAKVNSVYRSGTTVTVTFTVANANKISRVNFDDWVAYDENGTSYKPGYGSLFKCGKEDVWSTNNLKFGYNASATFSFQIKDVPASVLGFSMIRIPLKDVDIDNNIGSSMFNNMLVFRNLTITAAPKTTTARSTTSTSARRTTATRTVRRTTTRR